MFILHFLSRIAYKSSSFRRFLPLLRHSGHSHKLCNSSAASTILHPSAYLPPLPPSTLPIQTQTNINSAQNHSSLVPPPFPGAMFPLFCVSPLSPRLIPKIPPPLLFSPSRLSRFCRPRKCEIRPAIAICHLRSFPVIIKSPGNVFLPNLLVMHISRSIYHRQRNPLISPSAALITDTLLDGKLMNGVKMGYWMRGGVGKCRRMEHRNGKKEKREGDNALPEWGEVDLAHWPPPPSPLLHVKHFPSSSPLPFSSIHICPIK